MRAPPLVPGMYNRIKNQKMARIARTLFPQRSTADRLTYNQTQAIQFLTRTGDIQKFNAYCDSCKMSEEERELCLNEVTVKDLKLGE